LLRPNLERRLRALRRVMRDLVAQAGADDAMDVFGRRSAHIIALAEGEDEEAAVLDYLETILRDLGLARD
jgi:hypothetical protein